VLTSMVKRVDNAVFDCIRETKEGHFTTGVHVFGLKEKGVGWVYDDRNKPQIPDPVKTSVDSLENEIVAGRIVVPSE